MEAVNKLSDKLRFQSPRSGQICLNRRAGEGKFLSVTEAARFNPLDRVKFVSIPFQTFRQAYKHAEFQSPRSGQICLNLDFGTVKSDVLGLSFNPLDRVKFV